MGNAALLLKAQGHEVLGADSGIYPPMSDVLQEAGIEILEGYDAERLKMLSPDEVVIGNAMSRGNPEVEWLLNQSEISYISLPQLFHQTILAQRSPLVVTGTHGKTTTSTIAAYLLASAGAKPGWLIGGVPRNLPGGAHLGEGPAFVIEGDEYDSAFFDKRSKFIHYRPRVAIINNLEFDHADIFRDLEDVIRTFRHFTRIIPSGGSLLINGDDANIRRLLPIDWTQLYSVGVGPENDLVITNFQDDRNGARFDLIWQGTSWTTVQWPLHGLFNARNAAMAALAAAFSIGLSSPIELDLSCLSAFQGVRRRQDVLHSSAHWTVLEDFAHHPTAVAGAIEAIRAAYPGQTLRVCFEPRSNTARTALFYEGFKCALATADEVYLGAVHRADRMSLEERLDTQTMASEIVERGGIAQAFESNAQLERFLQTRIDKEGSGVWLFFTNGSFDGVPHSLAQICAASEL